MAGRRRAASAEGGGVPEVAAGAAARTSARPGESWSECRPPVLLLGAPESGPGRGREPPILLGTSRQRAPLCSREGEARRLPQVRAGKPEAQGPGCKVRPAFLSEAAPAVSDSGRWLRARPGKGVGCAGRGPGSASRGGARGALFPGLAARPTARLQPDAPVCCPDLPDAPKLFLLSTWNGCPGGGSAPQPRQRSAPRGRIGIRLLSDLHRK